MSRTIRFFATRADILPVLHDVEKRGRISYVVMGLLANPEPVVFSGAEALPDLGTVTVGDAPHAPSYLVVLGDSPVNVERVPQRRGGVRFAVDQLANPGSAVFCPGGAFDCAALIPAYAGTIHDDAPSIALFKRFAAAIRRRFTTVRAYHVGQEAHGLWRNGLRLTASVRSGREYDLAE